jgi:hypothetical protein
MDSSIHAHLISQYVQDRVERAERMRVVERRGVRLPRIAWLHTPRRRAGAYGTR